MVFTLSVIKGRKYWSTPSMNNVYPVYEMSLAFHEKLVYYY